METIELRKIIENFSKYQGTKAVKPANLVNSGFPSCFNLSFGEGPMHELYGQYLDYDQDLVFTTIQPCIRHEDWKKIINNGLSSFRYLNLFDMAGIGGMTILQDSTKQEEVTKFHMKTELDFFKSVGLDLNKLKILYFIETPIPEATNGKYKMDKVFPTDPFYEYWFELGLKESQLVPDKSRDTMLALNVFGLPTPWGYRYEMLYEYDGELWDIGTVEYLTYRPLFDEQKNISDVVPFDHCFGTSVVGLERIAAIVNDKKAIWEIDIIYPLIDLMMQKSSIPEKNNAIVAIQAFRAIHKITSEGNYYKNLNTRRKEYIRNFYRGFFSALGKLNIDFSSTLVKDLCELNSKLNPWHRDLEESIEFVVDEFNLRYESFKNDKSIKNRDVAQ
ncbi:MAG: hypothetical protein WA055_02340 [Candidatus Moraniibacteriota bacterium]